VKAAWAHHAGGGSATSRRCSLPQRSYAGASCGCTLSADVAMGYSAMQGWRLSVEYDYINQD